MSEPKFTPGPLRTKYIPSTRAPIPDDRYFESGEWQIVTERDDRRIDASPTAILMNRTPPETKANAILYAAAPDLYAALYDLVRERDEFGGCPESSPAWEVARAALSKARGE